MNLPAGFTVRPATPADAAAAAALWAAFERAHLREPDQMDESEILGWWSRFHLPDDSALVFGRAGDLAACATLDTRAEASLDLDACVHPEQAGRGLGGFLLAWAEEEARARGRAAVRTATLTADAAATDLVDFRGFVPVRRFYRMLIDLDAPPPEPALPGGFEVSTFAAGDEAILHAVIEEAFADHWDHHARDLDDWQRTVFGQSWWDPSLVHLIRTDGETVAAAINAIRFGMGWIGTLGTRPAWRGRGLARALLLTAFGKLYARGERRIGLAVDAGNETGATHLYERAGMRVAWQADVYEKHV